MFDVKRDCQDEFIFCQGFHDYQRNRSRNLFNFIYTGAQNTSIPHGSRRASPFLFLPSARARTHTHNNINIRLTQNNLSYIHRVYMRELRYVSRMLRRCVSLFRRRMGEHLYNLLLQQLFLFATP